VLSCVGSGLATGCSLVQGVLPTVYKCKNTEPLKEEAKARNGLQRHIRRRIMRKFNLLELDIYNVDEMDISTVQIPGLILEPEE
jgi:hypothetical protein